MSRNTLYVGNLYCMVSRGQLRDLCSKYGTVLSIDMIEGTGYAYVQMRNAIEAENARRGLDGQEYLERVLRVKNATPLVPFTGKEVNRLIED